MSLLDDILALTAEVETAIDAGDWRAATDSDRQRQQLLRSLLAGRDASELDADTRRALQGVLSRNQASVARLTEQRRELAGTRQQLRRAAVAVRAYQDASEVHPGD